MRSAHGDHDLLVGRLICSTPQLWHIQRLFPQKQAGGEAGAEKTTWRMQRS
ncbi:hypothetical protein SH139x_004127 [Planctomycetaceae bacterium SH139]